MLKEVDFAKLEPELAKQVETEKVDTKSAPRWTVRGVSPRLVCSPSTPESLAVALAGCDEAGAAVLPWGGGTQQRLGLPPKRADVAISTRKLDHLLEYEPTDLTATVESGMLFRDFQSALGEKGQWLPLDPPLEPNATIGGLVATNVSGPRRLKDGGLRDLVIGTRVANVNGTVTRAGGRVVKNVTGYDLNKMYIGSLGTLGVIVEVTFKVAPRPETERSWFASFSSGADAGGAMAAILRSPLAPSALDIMNDATAGKLGIAVAPRHWILLARASGFGSAVERHLREFDAAARGAGAVDAQILTEEARKLWESYSMLAASARWSADAITCRLPVPPSQVGTLCDRVASWGGDSAIWSHGAGAVFWSIDSRLVSAGSGVVDAMREMARSLGGALVVENWPNSLAGLDVWGLPAGPLSAMQALKEQYDPHGTLNPGRYVGGI